MHSFIEGESKRKSHSLQEGGRGERDGMKFCAHNEGIYFPLIPLFLVLPLSLPLCFSYDTLQDSVKFAIHQFWKILSYYQYVYLSYVYPSVRLYLAYFTGVYLCLSWSICLSVTCSKAILLFDKQNKVTYIYAEL